MPGREGTEDSGSYSLGEGMCGNLGMWNDPPPAWGSWLRHAEDQLEAEENAREYLEYSVLKGLESKPAV